MGQSLSCLRFARHRAIASQLCYCHRYLVFGQGQVPSVPVRDSSCLIRRRPLGTQEKICKSIACRNDSVPRALIAKSVYEFISALIFGA
jgi:hypothetical protein